MQEATHQWVDGLYFLQVSQTEGSGEFGKVAEKHDC
jgi:hypothetical protein